MCLQRSGSDNMADQVVQLQEQLAELKRQQREREARMEDEVETLVAKRLKEHGNNHADELEYLRQEGTAKEKASAARVRETFEKQLRDMEEELRNAKEKIAELAGLVNMVSDGASEQANAEWLRDDVKRERKRTREVEKVVEKQNAEIAKLKQEIVEAKQQQYKEAMENVQRESAGDSKAYKQLEQYQNENKSLRQQLQARDPKRIFDLEGQLKIGNEEIEKLRVEVKTLQTIVQRQEKAIGETQDIDAECASKVNHVFSDLQVSKAETARVREKLEQAEKSLKSRAKIEEGLRSRMETAEKKAASMEKRLKEARTGGNELLGTIDVQRAAATREELEHLKRKCLALEQQRDAERKQAGGWQKEREKLVESLEELAELPQEVERLRRKIQVLEQARDQERKRQSGVLREKDKLVLSLQELSEQQQQELEAKSMECRALAIHAQELKSKVKSLGGSVPASARPTDVSAAQSDKEPAAAAPRTPSLTSPHPAPVNASLDRSDVHTPSRSPSRGGVERPPSSVRASSSSSMRAMARLRTPSGGLERLDAADQPPSPSLSRASSARRKGRSGGVERVNSGLERLDGDRAARADAEAAGSDSFGAEVDDDVPYEL